MARDDQNLSRLQRRVARYRSQFLGSIGRSASALFATLIVCSIVAALALISHNAGTSGTGAHDSGTPNATALTPTVIPTIAADCGTATTPACPTQTGDWISITSDTPAAVLAAFKQSGMYAASLTGKGDGSPDLSRPETPVFERELHIPGGLIVPDVYVIPFDAADGSLAWFAICNINATHTAIEAGEIAPGALPNGQPRPHGQLTPVAASAAAAAVHVQRNIALRAGVQPALVFVEIDATLIETGQVKWTAPAGPQNPFWLVPGADGHDYLVDTTGQAHLESEVPIEKAS